MSAASSGSGTARANLGVDVYNFLNFSSVLSEELRVDLPERSRIGNWLTTVAVEADPLPEVTHPVRSSNCSLGVESLSTHNGVKHFTIPVDGLFSASPRRRCLPTPRSGTTTPVPG